MLSTERLPSLEFTQLWIPMLCGDMSGGSIPTQTSQIWIHGLDLGHCVGFWNCVNWYNIDQFNDLDRGHSNQSDCIFRFQDCWNLIEKLMGQQDPTTLVLIEQGVLTGNLDRGKFTKTSLFSSLSLQKWKGQNFAKPIRLPYLTCSNLSRPAEQAP